MRVTDIRGGDAQARLARALRADARREGCDLEIEAQSAHPWASATYVGDQQRVKVRLCPEPEARRWIATLGEADLPMRGHIAMPPAVDRIEEENGELIVHLAVLTLHDS